MSSTDNLLEATRQLIYKTNHNYVPIVTVYMMVSVNDFDTIVPLVAIQYINM